jgi:signal peptidase I
MTTTAPAAPVGGLRRARPTRQGRSWTARAARAVSGVLLAVVALTAVAGAVVVVTMRLSFAPVLSASMEPAFGPGDLLLTRALDAAEIQVGDVLVLPVPTGGTLTGTEGASGDRYVHRVVSVTRQNGLPVVKTKGDNNDAVDPWQLRIDSAKVPVVVADVPNVGRLSLITQGAGVRIALIVLVAGFALVGIKRALLDPR